jgi:hypothetical protein
MTALGDLVGASDAEAIGAVADGTLRVLVVSNERVEECLWWRKMAGLIEETESRLRKTSVRLSAMMKVTSGKRVGCFVGCFVGESRTSRYRETERQVRETR